MGFIVERNAMVVRRGRMIIVSGVFESLFFLLAIGIGVGVMVGEIRSTTAAPIDYALFVAPALLAASAMNGAVYESTFAMLGKLRWSRVYQAVIATPVSPREIALGEVAWSMLCALLYATGFLGVMVVMGLVVSPLGWLVPVAAALIGFAFGAVGVAATTYMRSWQDFDVVQLVMLPLFLLSTVFFPAEVYPPAVRPALLASPLYHGVELVRSLTLGTAGVGTLGHVAVLLALGTAGAALAARRFDALLRP